MKINLQFDERLGVDEIVLTVSPENDNAQSIIQSLESKSTNSVAGKIGEKIYLVNLKNIELFYSYDGSVMFLANGTEYMVNNKLFELENKYENKNFMRISKSSIVNIEKVDYLSPIFNKKLIFKMESGRQEYSSRTYYSDIKKRLGV